MNSSEFERRWSEHLDDGIATLMELVEELYVKRRLDTISLEEYNFQISEIRNQIVEFYQRAFQRVLEGKGFGEE